MNMILNRQGAKVAKKSYFLDIKNLAFLAVNFFLLEPISKLNSLPLDGGGLGWG
jgi:hypothetical protein